MAPMLPPARPAVDVHPRVAVDGIPHDRDIGVHPVTRALVREPRLLHDAPSGGMTGSRDADDAVEMMLCEAEPQSGQRCLGGEAATPPSLVQLEPHLDLVDTRPVIKLIETDPADPGAGRLVDSRPRAEPVHAPLSQAALGDPDD